MGVVIVKRGGISKDRDCAIRPRPIDPPAFTRHRYSVGRRIPIGIPPD
jgi:hypothetical protein